MSDIGINVERAAQAALALKRRDIHPDGHFDNGGRWYPDALCDCCQSVRSPSRAYPYSLLVHQRTVKHVSQEYGVPVGALRKRVRELEIEGKTMWSAVINDYDGPPRLYEGGGWVAGKPVSPA